LLQSSVVSTFIVAPSRSEISRSTDLTERAEKMGERADAQAVLPILSSAIASTLTGTALVVTRYVVPQADGLTVATLRYVLAAGCLLFLVPVCRPLIVDRRDLLPIIALGVLYFGLFPWCISAAMQYTTASEGAIVLASTPALTLLLGELNGSESLSVAKGLGVVCAALGAVVAYKGAVPDLAATDVSLGTVLMVLAAVSGAVYAVFSKPYVVKYSPLSVTAIAMGAGAIALSLVWLIGDRAIGLPRFDLLGWLAISYIGIAGGAVSFFLYAWAIGRASPTTIMILLPLNPIAALVAGSLWLGEPLGVGLIVGLVLIIIGILLVVAPNRGVPPVWPSWKGSQK
jgi:drug/metabolite transporter (DMT)-like permease